MREPRNRIVQVRRFGDPDKLEVVDAPLPIAKRGEVRWQVALFGRASPSGSHSRRLPRRTDVSKRAVWTAGSSYARIYRRVATGWRL